MKRFLCLGALALALGGCAERRAYPCPGAGSMKDTYELTVAVVPGAGRAVSQLEIVCEARP